MNRDEILTLVREKKLDYRPDNVSVFREPTYPNSVVIESDSVGYQVYLTGPRNEVNSVKWHLDTESAAIEFFLTKVEEEKKVADKYKNLGLLWPPSPV